MITLIEEGIINVIRVGGCQCDPPGAGEEFCTGHCRLRAQLAEATEQLRRQGEVVEAARKKFWTARSALGSNPGACTEISCAGCECDMQDAGEYLDSGLALLQGLDAAVPAASTDGE